MTDMTKAERLELTKIVRARAKIAKDDVSTRQAQILAEAEAALAQRFRSDDQAWAGVMAEAKQYMAEVQAKLQARCDELGIHADFRPSTGMYWMSQGRNAEKEYRTEMRRLVRAQAEASARSARTEIDRQSVALQEQLMAGLLESDAAREFLASLPTPEALMPALSVDALSLEAQ